MKTDIRPGSAEEEIQDLPSEIKTIVIPPRRNPRTAAPKERGPWSWHRPFQEEPGDQQIAILLFLLTFAVPPEELRETGWRPEAWAWDVLMDIARLPELPPEVGELLRREFQRPKDAGEIKRPGGRGRGRPREGVRNDLIVRYVDLFTAGGMRKNTAFQEVGKLLGSKRTLKTSTVRRRYRETLARRKKSLKGTAPESG